DPLPRCPRGSPRGRDRGVQPRRRAGRSGTHRRGGRVVRDSAPLRPASGRGALQPRLPSRAAWAAPPRPAPPEGVPPARRLTRTRCLRLDTRDAEASHPRHSVVVGLARPRRPPAMRFVLVLFLGTLALSGCKRETQEAVARAKGAAADAERAAK